MISSNVPFGVREMFIARTHHRRVLLDATDRATGSRIGGAPPVNVAAERVACPRCDGGLEYVLTLAEDTLQPPIARGRAVSLLCCRSFNCLWESQKIIDSPSIVLLTHDDQPRAEHTTPLEGPTDGLGLTLGPFVREELDDEIEDYTKLGGEPGYIQNWGPLEADKALASGRGFLFQYNSPVFPEGHRLGPDPLGDGVVYVFSRIDPVTRLPTLTDCAAFWQIT